jgi:hypothetical protein
VRRGGQVCDRLRRIGIRRSDDLDRIHFRFSAGGMYEFNSVPSVREDWAGIFLFPLLCQAVFVEADNENVIDVNIEVAVPTVHPVDQGELDTLENEER